MTRWRHGPLARASGLFSPLAYHGFRFALGDVLGPRGILLAGAGVVALTGVLLLARRPIREITSG